MCCGGAVVEVERNDREQLVAVQAICERLEVRSEPEYFRDDEHAGPGSLRRHLIANRGIAPFAEAHHLAHS
jgi:hypothetical protein